MNPLPSSQASSSGRRAPRSSRVHRLCFVLGSSAWAIASAAFAEPVRVVRLSPPTLLVQPGQVVSTPFMLRVERTSGEPIPGVELIYWSDLSCPAGTDCPTTSEIGGFEDDHHGDPLSALVTTGSDGTGTTPLYRAGTPTSLPFHLYFQAYVPQQTTPGGIVIDGMLSSDDGTTVTVEGILAVPTIGSAGAAILAGLLAAAGVWTLTRTRS